MAARASVVFSDQGWVCRAVGVGERPWLHSGLALRPAGLRGAIHLCNPRRWDCRALASPARSARPACSPLLSPRPLPSPWKESLQLPTPCFSEIKNVCPLRTAGRVRGGPEVSWGGWCAQPDMPAAACFPSSRGTRELILVPRELPSAARLGSCQPCASSRPVGSYCCNNCFETALKKKKGPLGLL